MEDSKGRTLIREDRWSKTYELKPMVEVIESKFETEGLSISFEELRGAWNGWSRTEKTSFVTAFRHKPHFSLDDEKILEFLLKNGNDEIWVNLALCLTSHSDKKLIFRFLSERIKSDFRPKANFCQALGVLGDPSAISVLLGEYRDDQAIIAAAGGAAERSIIMDFLSCCAALKLLNAPGDYVADIAKYLNHPDEGIRRSAERKSALPPQQ